MTRPRASAPPEILLVEDNPGDVELVREGLQHSRIAVRLHVAGNGDEALAFLLGPRVESIVPPDLVLLDLNLPVKEGKETLREIRLLDCPVPVVVFTGSDEDEDVAEVYRLGANCYVVKPPDLDEYLACVGRIVGFWLGLARLPPRAPRAGLP